MTFFIPSRTVQLEAILREPRGVDLRAAAVVCHPHPGYGGTMDNRVVYRAAKAVQEAGIAALRFNFRGVGRSSGSYDEGIGEQEDAKAALDWLESRYPELPLALAGFSFGSWVGLQVACADPRVQAVVGLGLPLNFYDFDFLLENRRPALYIVGTNDEYCAPERLDRLERRLPRSSSVRRIDGADHFFIQNLEEVQELITGFFRQLHFEEMAG